MPTDIEQIPIHCPSCSRPKMFFRKASRLCVCSYCGIALSTATLSQIAEAIERTIGPEDPNESGNNSNGLVAGSPQKPGSAPGAGAAPTGGEKARHGAPSARNEHPAVSPSVSGVGHPPETEGAPSLADLLKPKVNETPYDKMLATRRMNERLRELGSRRAQAGSQVLTPEEIERQTDKPREVTREQIRREEKTQALLRRAGIHGSNLVHSSPSNRYRS